MNIGWLGALQRESSILYSKKKSFEVQEAFCLILFFCFFDPYLRVYGSIIEVNIQPLVKHLSVFS